MPPEKRIRPDVANVGADDDRAGNLKSSSTIDETPDANRPPRLTGCPCGCLSPNIDDPDCIGQRPMPDPSRFGHCCQSLDHDQREAAARRGLYCRKTVRCARQALGLEVA